MGKRETKVSEPEVYTYGKHLFYPQLSLKMHEDHKAKKVDSFKM